MHPGMDDAKLRLVFPWAPHFATVVRETVRQPFSGMYLMVGSDYSGDQSRSDYRVYGFLVADTDASLLFPHARRRFRAKYLPDGRRMSYKRLNDALRRNALAPFLGAVETFTGVCCAVVVHKDLQRMSTGSRSLEIWSRLHGLDARWAAAAFETMVRIVHFVCLLLGVVSHAGQDVTWITDEDEIVANDDRLTDVMNLMDLMGSLYIDHPLGVFAMNSTQVDSGDRAFEDFVALPDLIAGAFADITTVWARQPEWLTGGGLNLDSEGIPEKASLIGEWFCSEAPTLKRCAVIVDRCDEDKFGVRRLCIEY
jgi:hypothetical protein